MLTGIPTDQVPAQNMRNHFSIALLICLGTLSPACVCLAQTFRIEWPPSESVFSVGTYIKIKAAGENLGAVQFFADGQLIAAVTNAPFSCIWRVERLPTGPVSRLGAVGLDNSGLEHNAPTVEIYIAGGPPPAPDALLVSPNESTMFARGESISIEAETLATVDLGDNGPLQLLSGTNLLAEWPRNPPFEEENAHFKTNIVFQQTGAYSLSILYLGANGISCGCRRRSTNIRVVDLGIDNSTITPSSIAFDLVVSMTNQPIIVERSSEPV